MGMAMIVLIVSVLVVAILSIYSDECAKEQNYEDKYNKKGK